MDTWTKIKKFFNQLEYKGSCDRARMHKALGVDSKRRHGTIADSYRCLLEKAGYVKKVERGVYSTSRRIPMDLTVWDAREQAYGPKRNPVKDPFKLRSWPN